MPRRLLASLVLWGFPVAVIAHELGHFRGGDAHHLARTQKVTDAMDRMVDAGGLFAAPLLWVYRRLYLRGAGVASPCRTHPARMSAWIGFSG